MSQSRKKNHRHSDNRAQISNQSEHQSGRQGQGKSAGQGRGKFGKNKKRRGKAQPQASTQADGYVVDYQNGEANGNIDPTHPSYQKKNKSKSEGQSQAQGQGQGKKGNSKKKWRGKNKFKGKHRDKARDGDERVKPQQHRDGNTDKQGQREPHKQGEGILDSSEQKKPHKHRDKKRDKRDLNKTQQQWDNPNKKQNKHKKSKGQKPATATDPHFEREKAKYGEPVASREFILSKLKAEKAPVNFDALATVLGIQDDEEALDALSRRVKAMLRDGQLIENRKQCLVPVDDAALLAGRITAHPDGFGFLIADDADGDGDIYLSGKQMRQVLHGDRAIVCITGTDRRGRREGRIVDVVERANHSVVGRFKEEKGVSFISPDNKRLHQDVMIPIPQKGDAVHGDIVVADIVEQPSRRFPPVGKIVEVLGKHMQAGMEIDMSLRSHDIPFEWPEEVEVQAAEFSAQVLHDDMLGRKDITRIPLVTIDGEDARDFDDAVYCERTESGWRLLVAIADVAHYVVPGSPLDEEAEKRGTSVYFPGRVVPMLPEVLSNGLCSINPKVERLCMLCEMTLDSSGSIRRARFFNAVMLSHARLTYNKVNEILTDASSSLRDEYEAVVPHLESLHELYKILKKNRNRRGVIDFESTETRIVFDDQKKISELVPVVRNDAHKLIEECMILANVAAAGFLEQHTIPGLFRVHYGPKADRLEDLRAFLSLRGLSLGGGDSPTALDYASLSTQIADRPDRSVISTVMLRSMQQATYQPRNDGHFGLALTQYAHFTSPIRRYPDLLVHRAIKHILKRESIINYYYSRERMASLGESCSYTERRAEEASRDVLSWLKCEYMQDHIGTEYDGVITSVASFGLFIELSDIHVEGLLHVTSLSRDYYRYDQAAQAMVGEKTGRQYRLGEPIRVRVEAVNLEERKIDFSEIDTGRRSYAPQLQSRVGKQSDPVASPQRELLLGDEATEEEVNANTLRLKNGKGRKIATRAPAVMVTSKSSNGSTVGKGKPEIKVKKKKAKLVELDAETGMAESSMEDGRDAIDDSADRNSVASKSVSSKCVDSKSEDASSADISDIQAEAKKRARKTAIDKSTHNKDKQAKAGKGSENTKKKAKSDTSAKKKSKADSKKKAKTKAKAVAKVSAKKKARLSSEPSAKKKIKAKVSTKKKTKAAAKKTAKAGATKKSTAKVAAKKAAKASASKEAHSKLSSKKKATAKSAAKATAKSKVSAKKKARLATKKKAKAKTKTKTTIKSTAKKKSRASAKKKSKAKAKSSAG